MNEWISVEDRLPRRCEDVFVQLENNTILVAYLNTHGAWVQLHNGKPFYSRWKVKKWFRPEPPKQNGPFKAISCEGGYAVGHYITGDDYFRFLPSEVLPEEQARKLAEWLNEMWSYRD